MGLFSWKKKIGAEGTGAYAPYEEIDAKRTSKLGYFFLILMVIFGIWQGNQFLAEVQDAVDEPMPNSTCAAKLGSVIDLNFYSSNQYASRYVYDYYEAEKTSCNFSPREISAGIDQVYAKAEPLFARSAQLEEKHNSLEKQRSVLERQKEETLDEYQASLLEEMADVPVDSLNPQNLGTGYVNQKQSMAQIDAAIRQVEGEKQTVEQELRALVSTYRPLLERVQSEYTFEVKKYQFIQFVISLVLVAPLFYFVWRRYSKSRLNRSEYTIIWGGAVATFGFILAQIILVFVYEILPREILQALFSFLAAFDFIWTILTFLGFILVPLFFGFLIYIIQKKLYNKQAVLMRTLKNGHCPGCSLKITPDMNRCPICGYTIKHQCTTCNHMTLQGGNFCSVCGTPQKNTPT